MMEYNEARKRADKAYQGKIHKMTIIFRPEDEDLWEQVHRLAEAEGGTSPFVRRILAEHVYGLSTNLHNF